MKAAKRAEKTQKKHRRRFDVLIKRLTHLGKGWLSPAHRESNLEKELRKVKRRIGRRPPWKR